MKMMMRMKRMMDLNESNEHNETISYRDALNGASLKYFQVQMSKTSFFTEKSDRDKMVMKISAVLNCSMSGYFRHKMRKRGVGKEEKDEDNYDIIMFGVQVIRKNDNIFNR